MTRYIPVWAGCIITGLDTFTFLAVHFFGVRYLEAITALPIGAWLSCTQSTPHATRHKHKGTHTCKNTYTHGACTSTSTRTSGKWNATKLQALIALLISVMTACFFVNWGESGTEGAVSLKGLGDV